MTPRDSESVLDLRLTRIENTIETLAWWLVSAQTGFGEQDAQGIRDLLRAPLTTPSEQKEETR